MKPDIVDRVLDAPRYRALDRALVTRLAAEELPRARNADDAVKRVKRRLHQVAGAFRPPAGSRARAAAWPAASSTCCVRRMGRGDGMCGAVTAVGARGDRGCAALTTYLPRSDAYPRAGPG